EISGDTAAALPATLTAIEPTLHIAATGEPDAGGFRKLTLTSAREDDLGETLLRALGTDGRFRVRALNRVQPSLEDVFLAATRRGWETIDAPAGSSK
ncbi:MAG TPA: ABC transporter ATP-binding protein, partial [Rariglobus sp.]